MLQISNIKSQAKKNLSSGGSVAFAIGGVFIAALCLTAFLASIVASIVSSLVNWVWTAAVTIFAIILLWQSVFAPLFFGILRWFWFTDEKSVLPFEEIFCYFSGIRAYLKAISLSFRIFLRVISILLICMLPAFIVVAASSPTTYDILGSQMPSWATYVWLLGNVLTVLGIIVSFILLLKYIAAPIIMINDNNVSPQEALHLSAVLTRGFAGKSISVIFSLLGWMLLSVLVIPMFYTVPYIFSTYCVYTRSLITIYNSTANPPAPSFTGYNGSVVD